MTKFEPQIGFIIYACVSVLINSQTFSALHNSAFCLDSNLFVVINLHHSMSYLQYISSRMLNCRSAHITSKQHSINIILAKRNSWFLFFYYFPFQKVQSRQEELKERARLLLEQARRDAALKARNKTVPSTTSPTHTRPPQVIDVSQRSIDLYSVHAYTC